MDDVCFGADLALVHHRGFGRHGRNTARGILRLLEGVRLAGGLVHEVGCGSGALTGHLIDAGHRVVASDASAAFVDLVRDQLPQVQVRRLRLPDDDLPQADAVVAVGHVLNYLPDVDAVRRALLALAASLRPGGLMLIDLCDLEYAAGEEGPWVRVEDDWTIITRFTTPEPRVLIRELTTFIREDDGRWRRSDERHHTLLLATADVPGWLQQAAVVADIRPSFGQEQLPHGLVALIGRKSP